MAGRRGGGFQRIGEVDVLQELFREHHRQMEQAAEKESRVHAVTPAERKLLDAAVLIRQDEATADDLAFMARELVQCTLPHRDPGDVRYWYRQNGSFTLSMQPGFDPVKRQAVGFPYGSLPRLLLFYLTAEAIRTGDRRIRLGATYNDFLRAVGLSVHTGGGKRSDSARLKEQARRLFNTNISFIWSEPEPGKGGKVLDSAHAPLREARRNMNVASTVILWWDPKMPDQMNLWENIVELSEEFYRAITAAPVPLDTRALRALKRSPLALDLYAWATHKALSVARKKKAQFIPWRYLAAQFGADYRDPKDFRKKAQDTLRKIQTVYPGLKLQDATGGVVVLPTSRPAVAVAAPKRRRLLPP
jgi:hypothetical protein